MCVCARTRTCLSLCVYADGRTKSGARASAQSASVHLPAHKLNCRDTRRRLVACQHGTAKHQILTPTFSLSRPPPHAPPRLALVLHASPLSLPVLISSRLLSRTGSVATLTSALRTRSICVRLHKNTQVLEPLSKRLRLRIGSHLIHHKFDSIPLRLLSSDVMRVCTVVAEFYTVSECVYE